jgi:anti-anti-sigma factor
MKIETQEYNDVTVIELQGDLDVESVECFHRTITESIGTNKTNIVVNFNDVDFIDSVGLEKLLWAKDYCDENNCQLRLAGLDENCVKILEITQLQDEFNCYAELSEAVKSFA